MLSPFPLFSFLSFFCCSFNAGFPAKSLARALEYNTLKVHSTSPPASHPVHWNRWLRSISMSPSLPPLLSRSHHQQLSFFIPFTNMPTTSKLECIMARFSSVTLHGSLSDSSGSWACWDLKFVGERGCWCLECPWVVKCSELSMGNPHSSVWIG